MKNKLSLAFLLCLFGLSCAAAVQAHVSRRGPRAKIAEVATVSQTIEKERPLQQVQLTSAGDTTKCASLAEMEFSRLSTVSIKAESGFSQVSAAVVRVDCLQEAKTCTIDTAFLEKAVRIYPEDATESSYVVRMNTVALLSESGKVSISLKGETALNATRSSVSRFDAADPNAFSQMGALKIRAKKLEQQGENTDRQWQLYCELLGMSLQDDN